MIEKLRQFILEAGRYANEQSCSAEHQLSFKAGEMASKGIVTEVDLTVSQRFERFAAENFADLNYMIIDEESIAKLKKNVFERAAQTDYQLVIDPIDGTMNYAAGIPMYGISIGVLKHGKPWLGLLYAPAFDELVYTDGNSVYFECRGKVIELPKNKETLSRVVVGHMWRLRLKPNHFDGTLILHDYFSAVIYFLYLALGRIRGAFAQANLWDVAGGMAICKVLGMGFYNYYNKKELTAFCPEDFTDKCRVKEMHIVGFERDFDILKNLTEDIISQGG